MKKSTAIALLIIALSPAAALAQPFCEYPARWVWRGYWSCEYPAPVYYYPRAYYPYYYPYGGVYLGWRGYYGGGHWSGGHWGGGHGGGSHWSGGHSGGGHSGGGHSGGGHAGGGHAGGGHAGGGHGGGHR